MENQQEGCFSSPVASKSLSQQYLQISVQLTHLCSQEGIIECELPIGLALAATLFYSIYLYISTDLSLWKQGQGHHVTLVQGMGQRKAGRLHDK